MSESENSASSFDSVSDLYERARPPYPDALFTDLAAHSEVGPDSRILEIGSGTGLATVPMASRGFDLTCLEPGPRLAAIVRAKLADHPRAVVVVTSFEHWSGEQSTFDLVYSAQAFHWLDPAIRFQKAASVLKPGGWLAIFGHVPSIPSTRIRCALDGVEARHAPANLGRSPMAWYALDGPIRSLFAESVEFEEAIVLGYRWSRTYRTSEYLDLLQTMSHIQRLPPIRRRALLEAVAHVVQTEGEGRISVDYDSNLFMARRIRR